VLFACSANQESSFNNSMALLAVRRAHVDGMLVIQTPTHLVSFYHEVAHCDYVDILSKSSVFVEGKECTTLKSKTAEINLLAVLNWHAINIDIWATIKDYSLLSLLQSKRSYSDTYEGNRDLES
jgi:hypothetical protein